MLKRLNSAEEYLELTLLLNPAFSSPVREESINARQPGLVIGC